MTILFHLLLCVLPANDGVVVDYVDEIELNSVADLQHGKVMFTQALFRCWDKKTSYHEIIAWRMMKPEIKSPKFNPILGMYEMRWTDTMGAYESRVVYARTLCKSLSALDIEVAERERIPHHKRRDLSKRKLVLPTLPEPEIIMEMP